VTLTKNEERHIARAMASVAPIADRIVVVDSGSTDRTVELARDGCLGGHRADLFANRDLAEQIGQDQFMVIERFDRAMRSMGGTSGKDRCHFYLIAHVSAVLEKIVVIFSPSL
jgi:hypothetical protein